ncbi:hypothetical protein SMIR_39385 [Streptomyces mirabilis]|uniref:DUF6207 family protein n=1 Tax=Streptomyces mirabilis TaxID=68239 RepID=UPI001BAE5BF8|nr:DUF6207 family protein [Streptomyces mirabilis]QUW85386.1 hypothetical protein SMIR_39385 [Streptomyces mirabilis]
MPGTRQINDAHVAVPGLAVVEVAAADDKTAFAMELPGEPPYAEVAGTGGHGRCPGNRLMAKTSNVMRKTAMGAGTL